MVQFIEGVVWGVKSTVRFRKLGRMASSSRDKEKISECVRRIEDVLKEFGLETSMSAQSAGSSVEEEIYNQFHDLRGRVAPVSNIVMVSPEAVTNRRSSN